MVLTFSIETLLSRLKMSQFKKFWRLGNFQKFQHKGNFLFRRQNTFRFLREPTEKVGALIRARTLYVSISHHKRFGKS